MLSVIFDQNENDRIFTSKTKILFYAYNQLDKKMEDRKNIIKSSYKQNRPRKVVKFLQIMTSPSHIKQEEKDQILLKNKMSQIFHACYCSVADTRLQTKKNIQFLFEVYKGVIYSKNLRKKISNNFLVSNIIELPNKNQKKKVLMLGLDQTLIYVPHAPLSANSYKQEIISDQLKLEENIQVIARPYLKQFLYSLKEFYNIYIFSSSTESYIRKILNDIDPNKIIKGYLSNKNCFTTKKGHIIKDLRIIGNCSLKNIVIIDKSVYSFAMQLENGIPIHPFLGDQQDAQLKKLRNFLCQGAKSLDIRTYIEKNLKLDQLNLIPQPYMKMFVNAQH